MIERDEQNSRMTLRRRLTARGHKWTTAGAILGECTPSGPWSEDLENLVREGLVECSDIPERMNNRSFVRIAS